LHTFSIGFADETYNELPDADRTAKYIGTIHHNKVCEMDDRLSSLYQAIDAYDELFSDTSLVPMVEVAKLASGYVKVVLSGDGADEIFAGYITHRASRYHRYFSILPRGFKRMMLEVLNRYLPVQNRKLSFEFKAKQFLYGSLNTPQCAHYLWRNIFLPEERVNILGEKYRELIYATDPFVHFKRHYDEVADLDIFDRHLYVDAKTWLADDILVKADRAAMNSSIESRSPYLDADLVGYAASLPYEYKMPSLAGIFPYSQKYILKKALKPVLPGFVLKKKKSGFNAPIALWLKDHSMNEFKLFTKLVFNQKSHNVFQAKDASCYKTEIKKYA
jgi:asparagine synthase (glutamine-hydrolysing)